MNGRIILCGFLLAASGCMQRTCALNPLARIFLVSAGVTYGVQVWLWPRLYNVAASYDNVDNRPLAKGSTVLSFVPLLGAPREDALEGAYSAVCDARKALLLCPATEYKDKRDERILSGISPDKIDTKKKNFDKEYEQQEKEYQAYMSHAGANVPLTLFLWYKSGYSAMRDAFKHQSTQDTQLNYYTPSCDALLSFTTLLRGIPSTVHTMLGVLWFGRSQLGEMWAWEGGKYCLDAFTTVLTGFESAGSVRNDQNQPTGFSWRQMLSRWFDMVLPLGSGVAFGYGAEDLVSHFRGGMNRGIRDVLLTPQIMPALSFANNVVGGIPALKALSGNVLNNQAVDDAAKLVTWLRMGRYVLDW